MKELRPESQKALKAIEEVSPEAIANSRTILDFLEDYPIYDAQFVEEKDGIGGTQMSTRWAISTFGLSYLI